MTQTPAPNAGASKRLLDSPALWICWGLVLAALAAGVPQWSWPPTSGEVAALVVAAVAAALLAAPQRHRPIAVSNQWQHRVNMHRNTLLTAGYVVLVAVGHRPSALVGTADGLALAGYLLLLDAATMPARVFRHTAQPYFLGTMAALVVAAGAITAMPGTRSSLPRIVAALTGCAVLAAVVAAAFSPADTRRVGSRRLESPESDYPGAPR